MESQRLIRYERNIHDYFDHHTIISSQDRSLILHPTRDNITIVRNGVDTAFFDSSVVNTQKNHDLVFVGNLSYAPNRHTVKMIAEKIAPLIPEFKILIAGANPTNDVCKYQSSQIDIWANLEDIRTAYASASIMVAPMEANTGMQNKLLEAMAMKLVCITSPTAAAAIGAENNKHLLVCETPTDYAQAIKKLANNLALSEELALSGQHFVREKYSWDAACKPLIEILTNKA
jgi:polysaccharide biosynthesis protein PslH